MEFAYLEECKSKLAKLLDNEESLTIQEMKQCENLNPFRNWLLEIV
jgi:hypothetical protein